MATSTPPTADQIASWEAKVVALEEALGSGVLEVWFKGRRETYRSTSDLIDSLNYFKGLIASATTPDATVRRTTLIQSDC